MNGYPVTYKPASVNMDAKMTCCLRLTRRRQRSGIGFARSTSTSTYVSQAAYQYKDYNIKHNVRNAFADEKVMEIDT